MRSDWSVVLIVGAALCIASAAKAGSTADDLAQIEAQHAVLKARLRLLETRAQMAARQADIERYAPVEDKSAPTVGGIEGVNGKLQATVVMDNGHVSEVVQGDQLPNGMRVVSIRPDGVVVQRADKKQVRLKPVADAGREAGFPAEVNVPLPPTLPSPQAMSNPPAMSTPQAMPTLPPMPPRPGTGAAR